MDADEEEATRLYIGEGISDDAWELLLTLIESGAITVDEARSIAQMLRMGRNGRVFGPLNVDKEKGKMPWLNIQLKKSEE